MSKNLAASTLSHMRKIVKHTCQECGKEFYGLKTAITDSNKCRQLRKRRKQRNIDAAPDSLEIIPYKSWDIYPFFEKSEKYKK